MSGENEKFIASAEDGVRLYNQLKFDVAAEGYKIIDKQITDPEPSCVFCKTKQSDGKTIVGAKVNDNLSKVQTIASLCESCAKRLHGLGTEDVEDSYVQNMIRFFFAQHADKIISGQYAEKRMNKYDPIYVEYWGLIKWSVEEKLLRQLINGVPTSETEGFTTVRCDRECIACSADPTLQECNDNTFIKSDHCYIASHSVNLYSPIRECWMNLELCAKCVVQINSDLKDMEHEIRSSYYEDYSDYSDKPRRESLEILCKQTTLSKNRVLFLETNTKKECVINILSACGVDKDNQIVTKMGAEEVKNENPQEEAQE